MSRTRDRTEDFKDTVHAVALSLGYNESKTAAILASFIMPKRRQWSPFMKAALKTLENIQSLEQFIVKHRKDYTDLHRTTEHERDSIEHEVTVFIKECKEQIDILKNRINDEYENTNSRAWLGLRGGNSNADIVAHRHGVVELASLLDAAQETETKMVEMSALNHLMATHVLQQSKQIEYLYDQAVEATKNVEMGNKELSQVIRRNSSSRTFLLLFLFVLTFSILFLDWYS